jgi:hypothetical protein
MGRPIAKKNFGNTAGKIAVAFHNGTAVVDGYIIKQLGSKRFLIGGFAGAAGDSAGDAVALPCALRQTAGAPEAGEFTITATPHGGAATNVKSISTFRVGLVGDASAKYKLGVASAAAGEATLAVLTEAVTNVNDATV